MNFRGLWSSTVAYAPRDGASYNGSSYYAMVTPATGVVPTDAPAVWELFAAKGAEGTGGSGSAYYPTPIDRPWGGANDQEFDRAGTSEPPAPWAWMNQGPTIYREAFGAGMLTMPAQTGADVLRGITRTAPAGWTVWTTKLQLAVPLAQYRQSGIAVSDGTTWLVFGIDQAGSLGVWRWTNSTTFGATLITIGVNLYPKGPMYLRVRATATNTYAFEYAGDGITWNLLLGGVVQAGLSTVGLLGSINSGSFESVLSAYWARFGVAPESLSA